MSTKPLNMSREEFGILENSCNIFLMLCLIVLAIKFLQHAKYLCTEKLEIILGLDWQSFKFKTVTCTSLPSYLHYHTNFVDIRQVTLQVFFFFKVH